MNRAVEQLARFRIPVELLDAAGVRFCSDAEVRDLLAVHGRAGQDLSGVVFPYRDPRDGQVRGHRVRLGIPLPDRQKYLSEEGCRMLFFPPNCAHDLADVSVPVVIVEAEKSALALAALAQRRERPMLPIATGGVSGWRRKNGTRLMPDGSRQPVTGPSPALDLLEWNRRTVIIALDSNVAGRRDLEKARLALAEELARRGAQVLVASVPRRNDVNGPDDLIAAAGDGAALELLDRAGPFMGEKSTPVPGVLASEVMPEEVCWLWENHVPLGKVTLFDGDPDEGKSLVSIDLAARLTRGGTMPDGSNIGCASAGTVIVSLEDGIADTIRPRLEAARAVLEKVRIISTMRRADGIERTVTLPSDLPAIEAAIQSVNAKLLVLDPLVAMLDAETNSYRDQDIRRALAPVATLAERTGSAVICIRHLTKGGGQNPKYRGGGSIGIIGAARAAFLFADIPGRSGVHAMAPVKGNLWRERPTTLEYTIEASEGQPVIAWHGTCSHTAESLLAQADSGEESNALADARSFLSAFLIDGPKSMKDVMREARKAGVSERTLYRAKASLGIVSQKSGNGMGQHWLWELLSAGTDRTKVANTESLATSEQATETKPVASTPLPKVVKPGNLAMLGPEDGNLRKPADEDALEI